MDFIVDLMGIVSLPNLLLIFCFDVSINVLDFGLFNINHVNERF